ncbi:MAG: peptidyl-tRNA hydrolase Pth2 [Candidatus Marsarchaeota archaeon]|jgi:PTH2 family peptidyl-tRNA hydrolase|nr:peptidyl-tRNA hydrolase Pth2 [Candidatus Marsarchaeota archaeon]MCL5114995.1 peptidyl-tRNA hydrolase Pth2 [Candidatus Marsarchaeota archaeon]
MAPSASIPDEVKQVIIIRADLDMGKGKTVAQGAHASVLSYMEAERINNLVAKEWVESGQKKIVLKLPDEESIRKLYEAFKFKKVPCALVNDAGLTQLPPGTITALGIGPWKSDEIDIFTSKLKLF